MRIQKIHSARKTLLLYFFVLLVFGFAWQVFHAPALDRGVTYPIESSSESRPEWVTSIPLNRWTKLHPKGSEFPFYRADHSGAAYDSKRNSIFMFGSDTHLHSRDQKMYELSLDKLVWMPTYPTIPSYASRSDAEGKRISGLYGLRPWAMHIYDSLVYDPTQNQLYALSGPKHSFIPVAPFRGDPTWIYHPEKQQWSAMIDASGMNPNFFAAGAVYDASRDILIGYASTVEPLEFVPLAGEDEIARSGIWELGPERRTWKRVSDELHHWGWFSVEFDQRNRVMLIFGGHKEDNSIWIYSPAPNLAGVGSWEQRLPQGDFCPGGYYFPAAYDSKRGKTLFMPTDVHLNKTLTCIYDYASNQVEKIPEAEIAPLGLNYTMVYASELDVFILIRGSFSQAKPTEVWALRLSSDIIARSQSDS